MLAKLCVYREIIAINVLQIFPNVIIDAEQTDEQPELPSVVSNTDYSPQTTPSIQSSQMFSESGQTTETALSKGKGINEDLHKTAKST